jgi:hypothetical protein
MNDAAQPKQGEQPGATKRPYARPELTVYGDLRRSTLTTSSGLKNDGGAHPNHKTA